MSATARGMLILCLTMALWAPACAMDAEPEATLDDIAETHPSEADVSEAAPTEIEVDATAASQSATCEPPGYPLDPGDDFAWITCQVECRGQGGTFHGCRKACCDEFTGCIFCYQQ